MEDKKCIKTKIKDCSARGHGRNRQKPNGFEYGNDIIILDCGLAFPDDEMLGVDLVIPDTTYLVKNKEKIRGIVLTHGHEDHIGALPYVLRDIDCPIYGTRFTLGLVAHKLKEHGLMGRAS